MASIELNFQKLKMEDDLLFYAYSIKVNNCFTLNQINDQKLVLNNRNEEFENEIEKNKVFQNLIFPISIIKDNLIIKPIQFTITKNKKNIMFIQNRKLKTINNRIECIYDIELIVNLFQNQFLTYLIFKENQTTIGEYVNILTINNNIKNEINDKLRNERKKYNIKNEIKFEIKKQKKYDLIDTNQYIKKYEIKNEIKFEIKKKKKYDLIDTNHIDSNQKWLKNQLLKSKIGLENPKATYYMASILQAFIHTDLFLDKFLENNNDRGLSQLLYNLFIKISSSNNSYSIKSFAESLNKIDNRYNYKKGNNPILFITNILENLDEENSNNIISLFKGKKACECEKHKEYNYEEDFLIYLIQINEDSNISINKLLTIKTRIDMGNEIDIMTESIIKAPPILIINIDELDYRGIQIEHEIKVCNSKYYLYAINSYTDIHSTM